MFLKRVCEEILVLVAVACAACGSGTLPPGGSTTGAGGSATAGAGGGGGTGGAGGHGSVVDRGPKTIAIDGDPNGLFWDATTSTLYVADDQNDRVLKYTDKDGLKLFGSLPKAPQNGPGLGQLVETQDGTLFVVRFGFGTAGDVVWLRQDGTSGVVPSLDPTRRRIGLTIAPSGALFDTYFTKSASGKVGAVAKLDPKGGEQDVATSFQKPVGVLVVGDAMFTSDQDAGRIWRAPVASPATVAAFATLPTPDLLCEGPSGSLFTGGLQGTVRKVGADGSVTAFATGFIEVRGVAYDAKNKRLFLSNHHPNGKASSIALVPVD